MTVVRFSAEIKLQHIIVPLNKGHLMMKSYGDERERIPYLAQEIVGISFL